jgi:hypothetical protein
VSHPFRYPSELKQLVEAVRSAGAMTRRAGSSGANLGLTETVSICGRFLPVQHFAGDCKSGVGIFLEYPQRALHHAAELLEMVLLKIAHPVEGTLMAPCRHSPAVLASLIGRP